MKDKDFNQVIKSLNQAIDFEKDKGDTGLFCGNAQTILIGDKFFVTEHMDGCCQHYVKVVIKKDDVSSCGYGLYSIDDGRYICNGAIASIRAE